MVLKQLMKQQPHHTTLLQLHQMLLMKPHSGLPAFPAAVAVCATRVTPA
jgi:hypothetical protein